MSKYKSILANRGHVRITKVKDLNKSCWDGSVMGFFLIRYGKPVLIGSGTLCRMNKNSVHTESMGLDKGWRRKGHGIELYLAIIEEARRIGAKRIYSSKRLNNNSGPMWNQKLREHFDVVGPKKMKRPVCCRCGCRGCRKGWGRYYIDL